MTYRREGILLSACFYVEQITRHLCVTSPLDATETGGVVTQLKGPR